MEALTNATVRSVLGGRWVKYDFIPTRECKRIKDIKS